MHAESACLPDAPPDDRESTVVRSPRSRGWAMASGVLAALVVLAVQAGGLVFNPLYKAGIIWHVFGAAAGLGVVALVVHTASRRRVPGVVLGFLAFWAIWWAFMPHALAVAPDAVLAIKERNGLGYCVLLSVAALCAGHVGGLWSWRLGWLLGLGLTGGIAVCELTTDEHLWITPANPWPFDVRIAAATYINPNNFGIVLISVIAAMLGWRATTRDRAIRAGLLGAALFAAVLVLFCQSRSGFLGLLVLAGLEVVRRARPQPGALRAFLTRHLRTTLTIGGATLAVLVALFTVPPLAARNPVLRMIVHAFGHETERADTLRIQLIRAAFRYWREAGWMGTGAGSYEPIMWNDPNSGVRKATNLHNGFVELLTQYGLVVGVALGALLTTIVVIAVRTRRVVSWQPRVAAVRAEMLGHLTAFVLLGMTASSSLALPVWWIMLANASACAARLGLHAPRRAHHA